MADTLKDRINQRLADLGLSAREASMKAGLSPDTLGKVISGKTRNLRGDNLVAVARVLDCDESWLIGSTGENPAISGKLPELSGMAEPEATFIQADGDIDGETFTPNQHVFVVGARYTALPGFAPGDRFMIDMSITPRDGDAVLANVSDMEGRTETVLRRFQRHWLLGNLEQPLYVDDMRVRVMGVVTRRWWRRDET